MKLINAIITTILSASFLSSSSYATLSHLRSANFNNDIRALEEEEEVEPVECPCWTPEELDCVSKINAHFFSCGGTGMLDNSVINHGMFSMTNPGENPPDMCVFILNTFAIGGSVCMRLVGSGIRILNLSNDDPQDTTAESKVGQYEACMESLVAKCDKMGMGENTTGGEDGEASRVNDFDITNPFAPTRENVPGISNLIGGGGAIAKNIFKQTGPEDIGNNSGD